MGYQMKLDISTLSNWILNSTFFHYSLICVNPSTQQVIINNDLRCLKYYGLLLLCKIHLIEVGGEMHSKSSRM